MGTGMAAGRAPEESCLRIDLAKNFRSRLQVVDAVNDVFGRLMSETVGGIPYDERAALYPGAAYPDSADCGSELLLAEKPGREDELGEKQAESLMIARRIKELRGRFFVTDRETGVLRPARYSDMVILLSHQQRLGRGIQRGAGGRGGFPYTLLPRPDILRPRRSRSCCSYCGCWTIPARTSPCSES